MSFECGLIHRKSFINLFFIFIRIGQSLRSGPEFCPRVNATAHGSPEILVSAGLPKSVRVKVSCHFEIVIPPFLSCNTAVFEL